MLLERIDRPADLKGLAPQQLDALAKEIRSFLVESISRTGGHLGPNLGVVELTIALHRVFDSPRDRLIWDTGHQAYVHKILTGRRESFPSLRKQGGLSGYPSRAESEHDLVENSHASTALSYAAGLAEARRRTGEPGRVIAVIGDGALTGGMAYEALNHIGHEKPDLLIILNDNGRSYQPTVGGLARHLAHLRLSPGYHHLKGNVEDALRHLPLGGGIADVARRVKNATKQLVAPQVIFEDLGLLYSGPIDGHDIASLERALHLARGLKGPVLIHVMTQKGNGYGPAVEDEVDQFHSPGPFDVISGEPVKKPYMYTNVFADALCEIAAERPDVVAITAAMASPTGLDCFAQQFPDRFFDVGIAEQHALTFAAGLAMAGLRPVVGLYSTFLQRAFDQLLMDICLHKLPVVITLDRAGVTGSDGPSHHGVFDLSFARLAPGLVIMAPSDENELRHLLYTALNEVEGPCLLRFPKGAVVEAGLEPLRAIPVGEWASDGKLVPGGVLVIGTGSMAGPAYEAARILDKDGIAASAINARYVKPLDRRLGEWASRAGLVVTVEDNVTTGGFGAGVGEALAAAHITTPLVMLGAPDAFLAHASIEDIHSRLGLDADGIVRSVSAEIDQGRYSAVRCSQVS
jgi:1-deoxy-D-xylulose-5-phosphate synthase